VSQVKLPKRLELAKDAERAHDALPGSIAANWVETKLSYRPPRGCPRNLPPVGP
jgi:hypothetical protein